MERIIAIICIALGTLTGVLGFVFAFRGIIAIPVDIWFSYLLTIISAFMVYVYAWFEKHEKVIATIASAPYEGLEVFTDSGSLLNRISTLTVGAKSVCTVNLSDTPETFHHLSTYFSTVHAYIKRGKDLTSFRRIAGIQNVEKIIWLIGSSATLVATSRLSVAFADMRNPLVIDLCFHIVDREDGKYTFIFPSVNLTGTMPAILVRNDLVAHAMTAYFDGLWSKLPHLHDGKKINLDAFPMVEKWFLHLDKNHEYTAAKAAFLKAAGLKKG